MLRNAFGKMDTDLPYRRSSLKYLIKAAASDSRFDPACNKKTNQTRKDTENSQFFGSWTARR